MKYNHNISNLKPGDEILLFKKERQEKAYQDQYHVYHPAHVVLEEVLVTVTETKEVGGDYNPSEKHTGFKAVSEDGREFYQNWESFPMTSHNPYAGWYSKEGENYHEYVNSREEVSKFFLEHHSKLFSKNKETIPDEVHMPLITKDGEFVPARFEYCTEHLKPFPKGEDCYRCNH
jgi:hypothetical protein